MTASDIRVLVVDDQELVRSGFCVILEAVPGIVVVGEAGDGAAALVASASVDPDVVLMDIRMPEMDGLEATRALVARDPSRPRIVMLTTFDLDEYVYEALRAGASGFLLKDSPRADLVAAVRAVAAGDGLLSPSVTRRVISTFARRPAAVVPAPSRLSSLTSRERDVLLQIARGLSNAEIAGALFVSEATVKTHVGNVLSKLGLRDRVQAVILAYEAGLVQPGTADLPAVPPASLTTRPRHPSGHPRHPTGRPCRPPNAPPCQHTPAAARYVPFRSEVCRRSEVWWSENDHQTSAGRENSARRGHLRGGCDSLARC